MIRFTQISKILKRYAIAKQFKTISIKGIRQYEKTQLYDVPDNWESLREHLIDIENIAYKRMESEK